MSKEINFRSLLDHDFEMWHNLRTYQKKQKHKTLMETSRPDVGRKAILG